MITQKPRIINSLYDLKRDRNTQLLTIFSLIAKRGTKVNVFDRSVAGSLIFGISDGHQNGSDYTAWRFQTLSVNLKANYHEVWASSGKDRYYLVRSYFHLYRFDGEQEKEYILLHCDASEPDDAPHSIYKQSPHLHIECAEHPVPKAHFALYNGRVGQVLKNIINFDAALNETILMFKSQVLEA